MEALAKTETVRILDLKDHPKNYRSHGQDQLEHIIASIKSHGLYKNIVIANDGTILAGHGTVAACRQMGFEKISVVRLDIGPDDVRALKVLTGDNEMSNLVEVNDRMLTDILKIISSDVDGLIGTGFNPQQLANLVFVTRHSSEIKDFDAATEWVGMPSYEVKDEAESKLPIIEITFQNAEDRDRFVEKTKLQIKTKIGDRKWSTTWPYLERNDTRSIKFEEAGT